MSKKIKHTEEFEPFNIVVFGGEGDLAIRKIYPALLHRELDGQFLSSFNIIAITRKAQSESTFYQDLTKHLLNTAEEGTKEDEIHNFVKKITLITTSEPTVEAYQNLKIHLDQFKDHQNIFYFSTPSSAFGKIAQTLKACNLIYPNSKVVLEKPLGYSLESSNAINAEIMQAFEEKQVYRIDHYLGKETVQNLMVLRFANNLFERAWDYQNIDNIQITVSEKLGVEKRADYYDSSGALLDMIQNHLVQLLCLVAMEPPYVLQADEVRNEKLKVLRALRPFTKESVLTNTVKGQYSRGSIQGEEVSSYLEDIEKYNSKTETFVAIKTYVDNWRWTCCLFR